METGSGERKGLVLRSPLVVSLLGVCTFGIYVSFWITRVARDINREMEETAISEPLLALANSLSIAFPFSLLLLLFGEKDPELVPILAISILGSAWYYPYMIVRARLALQFRTDTLAVGRGAFGPMLTYLFGIGYLQWRLNWHLKKGKLSTSAHS